MNHEQLTELYGKKASHSEHKAGSRITFRVGYGSFPVILASYGFKDHSLKSHEEAENLVENVKGQDFITLDNEMRVRVLSARIDEIGEGKGRVIATCETVQDEESH